MMPLDDIFSYYSSKFVQVRHFRLGCFYYLQILAIFLYIFVYLICYQGHHLQPNPIEGNADLRIQHPTQGCNPLHPHCKAAWTPLAKLPYCDVYKATSDGPKPSAEPAKCDVRDNINISIIGHAPGVLFVPTRFSHFEQKRDCEPSEENGYWCENLFSFADDFTETSYYLADAERFTMLVDHSFQAISESTDTLIEDGAASDSAGSILPDGDRRWASHLERWKGKGKVQHSSAGGKLNDAMQIPTVKEDRLSSFPSVFMISLGDIISIGDLLKLADPRGASLLDTKLHHGHTMRWSGAVIEVSIEYSNLRPWDPFGKSPTTYVVSASILGSAEYKKMSSSLLEKGRIIHDVHGFLIVAKVHGRVHRFEFQALLQVLTTSMALIAVAQLITDYIMIYALKFKAKYSILKYQKSQRFSQLIQVLSSIGVKSKELGAAEVDQTQLQDAHETIIHKAIESGSPPVGTDLLQVLATIEQRLNRMDGMGAQDMWTASSPVLTEYINEFEKKHWLQTYKVDLT